MRALAVVLPLATLAVAGCIAPGQGGAGRVEVCLDRAVELTWREPDMGGGFAEAARRAGWNVTTQPPRAGLPAPMPDATVFGLSWRPDATQDAPVFHLLPGEGPDTVELAVGASADRVASERAFAAFLGHVGLDEAPAREAWTRALFPDAGPDGAGVGAGTRSVEVRERPDLSEALAALRDAPLVSTSLGEATMQAGAWEARVRLPVHAIEVPGGEDAPTLWADGQGSFRARLAVEDFSGGMQGVMRKVEDAFAALGLPPPTFRDGSGGGVGC